MSTWSLELTSTHELSRRSRRNTERKTYTSIEALCDDPDIDTVWIATPNTFTVHTCFLAAERGKHIIVESPWPSALPRRKR